jgi:phosphoribosylformylglycinamidine synthase
VSVFEDNAGIVKFDETDGLCIKVETHNHPSAIEPYGGAATGIGGCIRDIIGTGQAAKPIANTDVFCVASPDHWREADDTRPGQEDDAMRQALPAGVLHPKRILQQVVAGVRDYGNRMGIPTVNGAVYFDDDFIGNPLVFAGCAGLIPLDRAFGEVKQHDRIIVLGGRTGRDGIHGATFSSAELTDSHAEEFSHAVQIGNPITEKQVLDVILQARDHEEQGPLFNAITDCGAGGFSSAVGEMGEDVGAEVQLDRAPLK